MLNNMSDELDKLQAEFNELDKLREEFDGLG